eukprot:TRINITY_DN930_c0_g1_i1.p1 TRINITY_DN930_c0_g1~~TRINITY_DN930_c0_g1_i1.p1  ORF type:complete len:407 (+),score=131.99 TRINITY_DN930_c0_g1_i1:190-1410(+)
MSGQQPFDFSKLNFNFGNASAGSSAAAAGGFNFADLNSQFGGRLGGLVGAPSGYLQTLPKPVQNRIKACEFYHDKVCQLEDEFEEEVRLLEIKYYDKYKPLWDKRAALVSGQVEPTPEELVDDDDEEENKEGKKEEETPAAPAGEDVKGIPDFWVTALGNSLCLEEAITEKDREVLKHLEDLSFEHVTEEPGSFKLTFRFAENNPFLVSTELSKTYHIKKDEEEEDGEVCSAIDSTELVWKEGKDFLKGLQGGLGDEEGSFFFFFTPPDIKEGEEPSPEVVQTMTMDFEMAVEMKDKIIPHAVTWYTGEARAAEESEALRAMLDGDDEGGMDDEGMDDEDDEDDDEDDDDDEEEDIPVISTRGARGGRGGRGGGGAQGGRGGRGGAGGRGGRGGAGGEQAPDCKQQ